MRIVTVKMHSVANRIAGAICQLLVRFLKEAAKWQLQFQLQVPRTARPARTARPEPPAKGPLAGEPALVAYPSFIVGAMAFGMVLIGVVPATAAAAAIPIILTAAAGMFLATIWAARIGQNAPAGISGIVGSFFLSYALLVLGLIHNWYGIAPTAVADTQKVFVISWIVIVTMLVLATLRMPSIFTVLFTLVDLALVLNLLGIVQELGEPDEGRRVGRDGSLGCRRVPVLQLGVPRHRRQGTPAGQATPAHLTGPDPALKRTAMVGEIEGEQIRPTRVGAQPERADLVGLDTRTVPASDRPRSSDACSFWYRSGEPPTWRPSPGTPDLHRASAIQPVGLAQEQVTASALPATCGIDGGRAARVTAASLRPCAGPARRTRPPAGRG